MAADHAKLLTPGERRMRLKPRVGDPLTAAQALWETYRAGGQPAMLARAGRRVRWLPSGPGGPALSGRAAQKGSVLAPLALDTETRAEPTSFETIGSCVIVSGHLVVRRGGRADHLRRHWVFRFRGESLLSVAAFPDRASALEAVA